MIKAIKEFFSALAAICGLWKQRDAEFNSPEMRQASEAKKEAQAEDQIKNDIATQNTDAVRKDLAE